MRLSRRLMMSGGSAVPYCWNLKASNTAKVRAAYQSRSRNVRVPFLGDSTMRGVDETAAPYNSQYPNAMPMQLAAALNSIGVKAGASNWYGLSGTSMADYLLRDSRLTVSGGASQDSAVVQGGAAIALTSAGSISFVTPANATKALIVQYDFFAGATISWQVDGGAATNIAQVGNNSIKTTTIPLGAAGIHTVKLNWVSGANSIFGVECYDDSNGRVEVSCVQWGISGGTTADMVNDSGSPHAGRLTQLSVQPPDLVIAECGLVNSWRQSAAISSCNADMQALVSAVKAAGSDFMFLEPPPDNATTGAAGQQDQYIAGMYQVAAANDVPVIQTRRKWLSFANAVASGWQVGTDAVHPAKAGYIEQANDLVLPAVRFALGI